MYTYLENIESVRKRYNFPYNLIGKIKDISYHHQSAFPFYKFLLYNDNTDKEYWCVVKERLFDKLKLEEFDSVVIEYAYIKNFIDIGDCFLIRNISKPVMGLTGNKDEDVIRLMEITKKLIESGFTDGNLVQSNHSQLNMAFLKFRKAYIESLKR